MICEANAVQFFKKVNIQKPIPKEREVYYFETDQLDLYNHGAILRSRKSKDKIKTAAKFKYTSEAEINWDLLAGKDSKCEQDTYLASEKIGCSINSNPQGHERWYSVDQENFLFAETGIVFDSNIKKWGPVKSTEWSWGDSILELIGAEDFVLEVVSGPKNFQSLELSVRGPLTAKDHNQNVIQKWLINNNVQLCRVQKGHTGELLQALIEFRSF